MFVGASLPVWSGVSLGTVTALPSTLTVKVSTGGGAGLVSVVGATLDMLQSFLPFRCRTLAVGNGSGSLGFLDQRRAGRREGVVQHQLPRKSFLILEKTPAIQIHDRKDHLVVAPHEIAVFDVEAFEFFQIAEVRGVRVAGPGKERTEVNQANRVIIERQQQLVARNVFRFGHSKILWRSRVHLIRRVIISGWLRTLFTKKLIHRSTISSA